MAKKFYITSAIPYVTGLPHLGHTLEYVISDVINRYYRLHGKDVMFTCGSDENGQKIIEAGEKENLSPQKVGDKYTKAFQNHLKHLNVYFDVWRRGSDKKLHWPGVIELWNRSIKNGDIYKKKYKGLYCVGCEQFYKKSELKDGKCSEHLKTPEEVEEENYFFKLSKYQKKLEELIESGKLKVLPEVRKNETLGFIKQGLEDFSVSRPAKRLKNWGIPVPGDETQVMYVWFDALTIYMTSIGWGYDKKLWDKYWPADVHVIGKGIYRFHTVYWPAMLLSAELPLPKTVLVHGYITSGGQKMAKSLGNVINSKELLKKYGVDAVRYYLLKEIPTQSDGDFTKERFKEIYNADLANTLGNLVSRVTTLCEVDGLKGIKDYKSAQKNFKQSIDQGGYVKHMEKFEFNLALEELWRELRGLDKIIAKDKPWEKSAKEREGFLKMYIKKLLSIANELQVFLPETADKILKALQEKKIKKIKPLFPRLE